MIETTNFKSLDIAKYDLVLAIVRHLVNPVPGVIHVPELSPSEILTTARLAMRDEDMWHESTSLAIYRCVTILCDIAVIDVTKISFI